MRNQVGVFVINLEGAEQRLQHISRELSAYAREFTRVPAVDGRKLDLAAVEEYGSARAERYMGRELIGAEYGCYKSHLAAASAFLASDAAYGLVLEDDAVLKCDPIEIAEQAVAALCAVDVDWKLINLGANKNRLSSKVSEVSAGGFQSELHAAHYFPMMASGLVWSRRGAEEFAREHKRIFAPVDNYFRYWLTRSGHGYTVWPAPITTSQADSQIMSASGGERKYFGRRWFYGLSKQKRLWEDKVLAALSRWRFAKQAVGSVKA